VAVKRPTRPKSRASHIPHVTKTRGAVSEFNKRQREHEERRALAKPYILTPADVNGKYDAARALKTTLGGERRPLTAEDLAVFRDNISTIARHYQKGLTAQQIINLSEEHDIKRANDFIHYAVPSSANRGTVRFITNASPTSDVKRHYTVVKFLDFQNAVISQEESNKAAGALGRYGKLAISCDCGRWNFWFRYIATIGGFNAAGKELGFPKIRNPQLMGIACMHILRTLREVQSGSAVKSVVARMIDSARADDARQQIAITKAEAQKVARSQAKSVKDVEVRLPGIKPDWDPLRARIKKKWTADKETKPTKTADKARADALKNLRRLKDLGQLSQADYDKIHATLTK
jgi:hypothetical protein